MSYNCEQKINELEKKLVDARKEIDVWIDKCRIAEIEALQDVHDLTEELAEVRKDTERLDWLLEEADPITKEIDTGPYMRGDSICFERRADIDAAMKEGR